MSDISLYPSPFVSPGHSGCIGHFFSGLQAGPNWRVICVPSGFTTISNITRYPLHCLPSPNPKDTGEH